MARPKKLRWKEGDWGEYDHGLFEVSDAMLRRVRPDLYHWLSRFHQTMYDLSGMYTRRDLIKEHAWLGSIQPGMVVSAELGRVAAYSRELDCVVMLNYAPKFLADFGLGEGSRLLAITYYSMEPKNDDLTFGPNRNAAWKDFLPIVVDFLTGDTDRLEEQKELIPETLWNRAWELGRKRLRTHPDLWRDGRPYGRLRNS